MFRNREDAARRLAQALKGRPFRKPIVLAIPRGGVVTGAVLAEELGADLDVVLSRKLHAPHQPEYAIGAVSEDGQVYLNPDMVGLIEPSDEYLVQERERQFADLVRRKKLIRSVRPRASVSGRSVIVTDDGIATGSTVIAALRELRARSPHELIVAVPVASPGRLHEVGRWCDEVVCLLAPEEFWAIGQFYLDFEQVKDERVLELLHRFAPVTQAQAE